MSDIVKGYRTYLVSKAHVTNVVGTRVYFGNLPQTPTYPSIVLNLIGSETQRHISNAAGLVRSTIQVDCHANDHAGAENASEKVRNVTEHYSGAWGTETCRRAYITDRRDLAETPVDGSQLFRRTRTLDVTVWHTETLPST